MREMYTDGALIIEIAKILDCTPETVGRHLKKMGCRDEFAQARREQRYREKTRFDHREILRLYAQGMSVAGIRDAIGCAYTTAYGVIREHLRHAGRLW